jgi:hypothetical protein
MKTKMKSTTTLAKNLILSLIAVTTSIYSDSTYLTENTESEGLYKEEPSADTEADTVINQSINLDEWDNRVTIKQGYVSYMNYLKTQKVIFPTNIFIFLTVNLAPQLQARFPRIRHKKRRT